MSAILNPLVGRQLSRESAGHVPPGRHRLSMKSRNVILALLGVAVLVGSSHYAGPGEEFVRAYAGNIAVSLALYFVPTPATSPSPSPSTSRRSRRRGAGRIPG